MSSCASSLLQASNTPDLSECSERGSLLAGDLQERRGTMRLAPSALLL